MGVLFCSTMAASLPSATWIRLLIWSVIGLLMYIFYGYKNSRLRRSNEQGASLDSKLAGSERA